VEPSDVLFNLVEASIALAGFAGIVTVLGRRSAGDWSPIDRARLANLLASTLTAFGSALVTLVLLSAHLEPRLVWQASSGLLLAVSGPATFAIARRAALFSREPGPSPNVLYTSVVLLAQGAALALQAANVVHLQAFWPYFAGLVVDLGIGASQFVRLLWLGIGSGPGNRRHG